MAYSKGKQLTHRLPPVPCTEDMRSQVVKAAKNRNMTLSEFQRKAIEFFLASADKKIINQDKVISGMEHA